MNEQTVIITDTECSAFKLCVTSSVNKQTIT